MAQKPLPTLERLDERSRSYARELERQGEEIKDIHKRIWVVVMGTLAAVVTLGFGLIILFVERLIL